MGTQDHASLVAGSVHEFAQQLCNGSQWSSAQKAWQVLSPDAFGKDGADIDAIRARLVDALGPVDETAADMHARAVAAHPDFGAWITEVIDDLKATVEIPGRR